MKVTPRSIQSLSISNPPAEGTTSPVPVAPDRYSRLDQIPWFNRDIVSRSRVLVVGAGALGNEVLKNLALFGVGRIVICDFDHVDISNLSRSVLFSEEDAGTNKATAAARRLNQINPHIEVIPLVANVLGDVGTALFGEFDVVVSAVDTREGRLAINRACWRMCRPFVDGALDVLSGVVRVFVPPHSACYECTLSEEDFALLSRRNSCGLMERSKEGAFPIPTTPVSASIIGALQAQEVLKHVHPHLGAYRLNGQGYVFDGLRYDSMPLRFRRKADEQCSCHEVYHQILRHPLDRHRLTVAALCTFGKAHGIDCTYIGLDREIVVMLQCDQCGRTMHVNRPESLCRSARCACGSELLRVVRSRNGYSRDELAGDQVVAAFGVPPMDVLTLHGNGRLVRVTCGGDFCEVFSRSSATPMA
jgi:molybdopterin/thiamine biosynthesis adenylyltransferase